MGNPVSALAYYFLKAPRGPPGLTFHPTDKSISTVHLPSHQKHCGGSWDLIQVYLEQKLAIEVSFHHLF